jgi:predicted nucleotidyltransferase
MRFKDYIKESIIDIPRQRYAPGVFDDADTNNPKLKQSVRDIILNQIDKFQEKYPVKKYSLIGSILTKRYRDDADLDMNILFDVPEEDREEARKELASSLRSINGKLVPGTKHPINYFIITDPELKKKNDAMADGVYDIDENEFVRRPTEDTFDPEKYEADFQKKVKEIDVVKGELARDLIDYEELKGLSTDDVLNLQDKINSKLEEIEDSIEVLVDIGDDVVKQRQSAFNDDMTPEEIRQFGKKHKLPKNIIYKYLEKYHYLKFYKKCKDILEDGKVTDDEIDSLKTEAVNTIAFAFGRFNPPTIGHLKLMDKVKSQSNNYKIYLSRSEDPKKNPLSPREKLSFMKKIFPQHARNIEINPSNNVLDILVRLNGKFNNIVMVAGSDRIREFDTLLKRYNDVKSRHGYYKFDNIKVVSAGERDPDAEGATGMSASKMRAAAEKGDITSFKKGLPNTFRDADGLMKQVRRGMKLAASYSMMGGPGLGTYRPVASMEGFEQEQVRDLYVRDMIYNINDKVDYIKEDIQGTVKRRGTNYIVIEDNNNNLHKAWIWDCLPIASDRGIEVREYNTDVDYGFTAVDTIEEDKTPQDKDVKKKDGTQPKKYYSGLSKDTKDKRADYFKNNDSNKPAPGDADAKTKTSKHTKKFRQMYGETKKELKDACWVGYKQVGMKKKGNRQVPNCVPESMSIEDAQKVEGFVLESYDIGHDYAAHASKTTPGEPSYDPKHQGDSYKPSDSKTNNKRVVQNFSKFKIDSESNPVKEKDVKEWAMSDATLDKYKERYKELWREKLDEVVKRMMDKI